MLIDTSLELGYRTVVGENVTDTMFAYDSLVSGQTYYWSVVARDSGGESKLGDAELLDPTGSDRAVRG